MAKNVICAKHQVLAVKCWHCNHGTALTRVGGEKGSEKARSPAYCLFMAVRAPVRRVMTGHYLFVVFSLEQGRPRFEC